MQYKIPTFDAAMKIVLILGAGMVNMKYIFDLRTSSGRIKESWHLNDSICGIEVIKI